MRQDRPTQARTEIVRGTHKRQTRARLAQQQQQEARKGGVWGGAVKDWECCVGEWWGVGSAERTQGADHSSLLGRWVGRRDAALGVHDERLQTLCTRRVGLRRC
jgi:hypothetical protein